MLPVPATLEQRYTCAIDALCDIAEMYRIGGKQEDAVVVLTAGLPFMRYEVSQREQAKFLTMYGKQLTASMHRTKRSADEALAVLRQAKQIAETLKDELLIADVLYELGELHFVRGHKMSAEERDFDTSLAYFLQALAIREAMHDEKNLPKSLLSVGRMYQNMGQNEAAHLYVERAITEAEQQQDRATQAEATNHLALLKAGQDDLEAAIQLAGVGLTLREQAGLQAELPYSYLTIAELYQAQEKDIEASTYYAQCYALSEKVQAAHVMVSVLLGIGYIHLDKGEKVQAREQFEQSLRLAEAIEHKTGIQEAEEALSEM